MPNIPAYPLSVGDPPKGPSPVALREPARGRPSGRTAGFTMIEMTVVVLILGILASLAAPNLRKAQVRAAGAQGAQTLHQVEEAVLLVLEEHGMAAFRGMGRLEGGGPAGEVQAILDRTHLSQYLTPASMDTGWSVVQIEFRPHSNPSGSGNFRNPEAVYISLEFGKYAATMSEFSLHAFWATSEALGGEWKRDTFGPGEAYSVHLYLTG